MLAVRAMEVEVLRFWDDADIYRKSLDGRAGAQSFVFYEGPPTANGMPHPGHCLTRSIKDVFPCVHAEVGRAIGKAPVAVHTVQVAVCPDVKVDGFGDLKDEICH